MKKAKMFLAAIAVFGIVGGALAFKAKSQFLGNTIYYATSYDKPASFSLTGTTTGFAEAITTVYTAPKNVDATVLAYLETSAE